MNKQWLAEHMDITFGRIGVILKSQWLFTEVELILFLQPTENISKI